MNTQHANVPLDGKNFAIGMLSLTAVVLFVGLLLVGNTPRSAQAIGHLDRQGDYIMMTHQVSNARENVLVIDAAVKTAIVYQMQNMRDLQVAQRLPLDKLPLPSRK